MLYYFVCCRLQLLRRYNKRTHAYKGTTCLHEKHTHTAKDSLIKSQGIEWNDDGGKMTNINANNVLMPVTRSKETIASRSSRLHCMRYANASARTCSEGWWTGVRLGVCGPYASWINVRAYLFKASLYTCVCLCVHMCHIECNKRLNSCSPLPPRNTHTHTNKIGVKDDRIDHMRL